MKVSVLIPCYNAEKFIFSTVSSVLNQTYQDFEIIIVNDGCHDNTENIVKSFNDSRIVYIYQENAGPSAARNKGIKNASGDYIAFLDADDFWYPEKLKKQMKVFDENPNINIVYNATITEEEGTLKTHIDKYRNYPTKEDFMRYLLCNMFTISSSVVIKKSALYEAGLFNEDIKPAEDWDLWMRLAKNHNFYYIDEVLVKLFRPQTSLSRSGSIDNMKKNHLAILDKFFNIPENNKLYEKMKGEAYAHQYFMFGLALFYQNRSNPPIPEILKNLYINFKYSPFYAIKRVGHFRFLARFIIYLIFKV